MLPEKKHIQKNVSSLTPVPSASSLQKRDGDQTVVVNAPEARKSLTNSV